MLGLFFGLDPHYLIDDFLLKFGKKTKTKREKSEATSADCHSIESACILMMVAFIFSLNCNVSVAENKQQNINEIVDSTFVIEMAKKKRGE